MENRVLTSLFFVFVFTETTLAQKITIARNKPDRREWFSNLGPGLHIDLSIESQTGNDAMEKLTSSSSEYRDWYFNELPVSYNPKYYDPEGLANLVKHAGIKYVMLTARRYDGFCFWDTKTTGFNIMNSAYGKDILKEAIEAFRSQGIAVGIYFTPDNYHFMQGQGYQLSRESAESSSTSNTALWELNKKQLAELLTNYGPIDLFYIDEKSDWANLLVANHVWNLKTEIFITGGAMVITDNYVPQKDFPDEWIGYFSLSAARDWDSENSAYNELEIIRFLVDTRCKGGNFILSVALDASGKLPENQDAILREVALWHRINQSAVDKVNRWNIQYENGCRFTSANDGKTIYVSIDEPYWKTFDEKSFFFRSMTGDKTTRVSVLGIAENATAYPMDKSLNPAVSITSDGLFCTVVKPPGFRDGNNLPFVIRIENAVYRDVKTAK